MGIPTDRTHREASGEGNWINVRKLNPWAEMRLFCFPYSGAGSSLFAAWSRILPQAIDVCPVELPGRSTRLAEPPYRQMEPLIQAAANALLPYLNKPFALFGHSLGALIAFELSRELQERCDIQPVHLFMSGHGAPQIPDPQPPIHNLPEPEFVEKLRALNGTPDAVFEHPELRALMLPILRADFELCETYVFTSTQPLQCPVTALGGCQDPYLDRNTLQAWAAQTTKRFSMHMFPGDHFYLQTSQGALLELIARELNPHFAYQQVRHTS